MAVYHVIAWKGIPASVEASDETGTVTRQLSDRFQALIDSLAMQLGLDGSDEYIEQWDRGGPVQRAGPAADVADAVVADFEARFSEFTALAFRR